MYKPLLLVLLAGAAGAETTDPAIGRLNHAGFRDRQHCTVSLIGPREALTAAHCVQGLPMEALHVVLGYDRGSFSEHLGVRTIQEGPAFDIARLCLDEASEAQPLETGPAAVGPMAAVGYPRSQAHLQQQRDCEITASDGDRAVIDCAMEPGMSGAPVLSGSRVIGVMSATSEVDSLAVLLPALPSGDCEAG